MDKDLVLIASPWYVLPDVMYLQRLSVSAKEIRRGSGKKNRVRRNPAALNVAVPQNLFLQKASSRIHNTALPRQIVSVNCIPATKLA